MDFGLYPYALGDPTVKEAAFFHNRTCASSGVVGDTPGLMSRHGFFRWTLPAFFF